MQLIKHQNKLLTICQRFFIEKSLEMLHLGTIDSYRVRLNNPYTALKELKYCLQEYNTGRIKHFISIKSKEKEKKSLTDECILLLKTQPNYLNFKILSQNFLEKLLTCLDENNYLKVISSLNILEKDNSTYLMNVINGLKNLIHNNNHEIEELEKIDISINILFSHLIHLGYSKGYLYKIVYGIFVKSLKENLQFDNHFRAFENKIANPRTNFQVIFRIDTTNKVYGAITSITTEHIQLQDSLEEIKLSGTRQYEFKNFNTPAQRRKFLKCNVGATDYLAALKKARSILSEYMDVVNLGLSDEFFHVHNRVLVIEVTNPTRGDFQNNINLLDGKYRVEKDYYRDFTQKLPNILNSNNIIPESKDKIKSAIRYLRLGNQSTEVEHKFINYWIGVFILKLRKSKYGNQD